MLLLEYLIDIRSRVPILELIMRYRYKYGTNVKFNWLLSGVAVHALVYMNT